MGVAQSISGASEVVAPARRAGQVRTRIKELRALAKTSPLRAQDQAWRWIAELGRSDDQETLAELFGTGSAESPRTVTEGMPVGLMRNMPGMSVVNAFLSIDSPWTGKTFHDDGTGGYNRVKRYSRLIVTLLAPLHKLRREGRGYAGFPFRTPIKAGLVEPKVEVLAIEYDAPEHNNPSRILPLTKVVDELVMVVPHTYLGRAIWNGGEGGPVLVGYFALKRPVDTET